MNCGGEHETNCSEVLADVWVFLDRECGSDKRDLLAKHLEECRPCLEQYGVEEHLKVLLARKCGGDQAPDEFRARLRASIRQSVIDHGGSVTVTRTTTVETTTTIETTTED